MLIDLYVLASERSALVAENFKSAWLADFDEAATEYEFPQHVDEPLAVYSSVADLIGKLIANPNEAYSIYWNNPRNGPVSNGMLFFTSDGSLIIGISVTTDESGETAKYLKELSKTVDGKFGYAIFEEAPPGTVQDFINLVKALPAPKIVEGSLSC